MRIDLAEANDFGAFLELAATVEGWFGPMANDAGFHGAVRRNIARRSALVARESSGAPVGGLLFSHHRPPNYAIGWIVVAPGSRSRGVGQSLVGDAFKRWVRTPCVVEVVAFGADHPGARSRRFYERLGFVPAEMVDDGPEGGSRQMMRLHLDSLPDWAR